MKKNTRIQIVGMEKMGKSLGLHHGTTPFPLAIDLLLTYLIPSFKLTLGEETILLLYDVCSPSPFLAANSYQYKYLSKQDRALFLLSQKTIPGA